MKIRSLTEIKAEDKNFAAGWQMDEKTGKLWNPRFGSVEQIVVCNDEGSPLYDQFQIIEKKGVIIVPYYYGPQNEIFIGLITCVRPIVSDHETGVQGQVRSIEVPKGFSLDGETPSQTAVRELEEETGYAAQELGLIGFVNPHTSYCKNYGIPIYRALINKNLLCKPHPESEEMIQQCAFHPMEEILIMVRTGQIFCGLTKAALLNFLAEMKA